MGVRLIFTLPTAITLLFIALTALALVFVFISKNGKYFHLLNIVDWRESRYSYRAIRARIWSEIVSRVEEKETNSAIFGYRHSLQPIIQNILFYRSRKSLKGVLIIRSFCDSGLLLRNLDDVAGHGHLEVRSIKPRNFSKFSFLSTEFVGGWAIAGACKPLFGDPTYRVFTSLNLANFFIPGYGNSSGVTINIG